MTDKIDASLQSQIDNQLMEQGAFTPVEFLISIGRLAYADYERWRMGEIEFLDELLLGNPKRIRAQLKSAIAYAEKIGLIAEPQEFDAWHLEGQSTKLKLSADETMHHQLSLRFVSRRDSPNFDMFFDSPVVVLVNSIVKSLLRRSLGDARHYLDELYQIEPNYADLATFDQLVEALEQSDQPAIDPRAELLKLQQLSPHARQLLGTQCRDFLVPLWRRLANALEGLAFSSVTPNLHNSYALAQAQDWTGVSQSILNETGWWLDETLCLRLAECGHLRQSRHEVLLAWCHLCWQFSPKATQLLDSGLWADPNINNLWHQYCTLEEELDLEEAMPTEDFPAWLLLCEPGLAHSLNWDLPKIDTAATQLYQLTHQLVVVRQAGEFGDELELRKALQVRQPALLRYFKSKLIGG